MDNYGNGPSTELDQTALGKILTGFVPEDVTMTPEDRSILRRLAEEVAHLAASDEMAEKRRLWTDHNALRRTRPLIFCDPENGWNEIITETQMECVGKLARRWEMDLRKEIFWGREMGDDKPIEPFFEVPYTTAPDDWGMQTVYHKTDTACGSQSWDSPIQDYDRDLPKLRTPTVDIDWETTRGTHQLAQDVLGDILQVRLKGTWWWTLGLTLPAVTLRGLGNLLMDFASDPDHAAELLSFISNANMKKLDFLEAEGLLSINSDGTYVGSGGWGYSDELSRPADGETVRCEHMWGFTESQETVCVSPKMYTELVFPYEKPLMERFGLTCYGCCEPINPRWETVRQHHRLRRVSVSAWANVDKMAAGLGDKFIFSYKPPPTQISEEKIKEDSIRAALREVLDKTRGCAVEMIMKDNHTIGNNPDNVVNWCRIAREEIAR